MSSNKILFVFLLGMSICANAQYIRPNFKKKIDVTLPLLLPVDTLFISRLEDILFDGNKEENKLLLTEYKAFDIIIDRCDSINFVLYIESAKGPMKSGCGYLKWNDYLYVFKGDVGDFFVITKSRKRFSYTVIHQTEEYPLWQLEYNDKDKCFKLVSADNLPSEWHYKHLK